MLCTLEHKLNSVFGIVDIAVCHARRYHVFIRRLIYDVKELNLRHCLVDRKCISLIIRRRIACEVCVINIECIIRVSREVYGCRMNVASRTP